MSMRPIMIDYNGQIKSLAEVAKLVGLGKCTIWYRYNRLGWRGEALWSRPYAYRKSKKNSLPTRQATPK